MSLLCSGRVGVLLFAASLAACGSSNHLPAAPAEPTLIVKEIFPTWGLVSGGTEVTLGGDGFQEATTITFGGTPATRVRVVSRRLIYVIAPAHAPGEVDVVVSNPGGRSTSPPLRYRYLESPKEPGPWDY
jgi:IPT/TIG domain-containing protein